MKNILYQTVPVLALLAHPHPCPASEKEAVLHQPADSPPAPKAGFQQDTFLFGPVIELTLSSDLEGNDFLLDLDTGRVLTPAQKMRPERLVNPALGFPTRESCELIWRAYLYGMGVDIINKDHLIGLASCDLRMDPADKEKWDSLSAGELVRAVERLWRDPQPLNEGTFGPRDNKVPPPHTFLFRTREGMHGILQITEIQRQPKKVKIRYKLVESGERAIKPSGDLPRQQSPKSQAQPRPDNRRSYAAERLPQHLESQVSLPPC
jgi:hypothetical protein